MSWIYRTSSLKKLLIAGLSKLYGYTANEADNIKLKTHHLGVQYNDTYCGVWTAEICKALVTHGGDVNAVKSKYKEADELCLIQEQEKILQPNGSSYSTAWAGLGAGNSDNNSDKFDFDDDEEADADADKEDTDSLVNRLSSEDEKDNEAGESLSLDSIDSKCSPDAVSHNQGFR